MKHKSAVLRVNLDASPEKLKLSLRLRRAAESVLSAVKRYNKIIVIAHRGRPVAVNKKFSLRAAASILSDYCDREIKFIPSLSEKVILEETSGDGVYMLENIRFFGGEEANDSHLAKFLASLGDIFINDDFATAHRKNSSNVGILKYIPGAPGPVLSSEIKNLSRLIKNPKHPFIAIIGGAKVEDKLGTIKTLVSSADKILLGGGPGNAALSAAGHDIGDSIGDSGATYLKRLIKSGKIIYPVDFRVYGRRILDIGPHTEKLYAEEISRAKTIIWAGPMGLFEKKRFSMGSAAIARAIAASKSFSVAGGGETSELIAGLGLENEFDFISTGGGAMMDYISGKTLPALKALKIK